MPGNMKKSEIINLLLKEEFGYLPAKPISVESEEENREVFCAGKALLLKIKLTCTLENGKFSFPVYYTCPKGDKKHPCFIYINFRDNVSDRYMPSEEIVDLGCGVLSFCYKDVTDDNGDFIDGLAGIVYPDGKREDSQCGKIGLWAWAIMRVMDYTQTLDSIDKEYISVLGHSRLGKTALLAGALDERFFCAFSNNSGCSGAALSRENLGEKIKDITSVFPFWFCKNYLKYADNEENLPFDQHYLIAANYPHRVYVASAIEDKWACPENEFLSCVAASRFYEDHGLCGFVHQNRIPDVGDVFGDGLIGYHLRGGTHCLSREDWQKYID